MSEFSADWLQLREAADGRARADQLLAWLRQSRGTWQSVVDLGAGTGANLRHLVTKLGPGQRWCCLDRDAALLAQLLPRTAAWAQSAGYEVRERPGELWLAGTGAEPGAAAAWDARIRTQQCDLAEPRALEILPSGALITASALLDLVSADWLEALIEQGRARACAFLLALSYDGRAALAPAQADDQALVAWVNRHQSGDKGFGPALGPDAVARAEGLATGAGYRTAVVNSDWHIGPDEAALQAALLDGWLEAALELAPMQRARVVTWRRARQHAIDTAELRIQVGHRDLVATPAW
jgi:hypothetical protein